MKIRLDQITDEPFLWREDQVLRAEVLEQPELLQLGAISWGGRVSPTASGYLFQARLAYEQTLTCPRCLGPSSVPVSSAVELVVLRRARRPLVGEVELEEQELSVIYLDEEELLDTQPILLEQLQLNIPMRALCREDCAGLCPVCGANLNEAACGCERQTADARWAPLEALRARTEE